MSTETDTVDGMEPKRAGAPIARRERFAVSFLTAASALDCATSFLDRTDLAEAFCESRMLAGSRAARFETSFLDRAP